MKNIECWEKLLKNVPESYKKWFKEEKIFLNKNIPIGSKVLEVGCGDGRSLYDVVKISKELVGIDHDKKAVKDARKNFKNYKNVKIILADAINLPFKESSFDFVICMGSFTNFADKKLKSLSEMKRIVKKEGKIIISAYSEDALPERLKAYKQVGVLPKEVKEDGTAIFSEEIGDDISEQFSKKQLEEIFKKTNLKIEEIKKVGIGYICKLSKT